MAYDLLEEAFDDVRIRRLYIHDDAEITCEAHPNFYTFTGRLV